MNPMILRDGTLAGLDPFVQRQLAVDTYPGAVNRSLTSDLTRTSNATLTTWAQDDSTNDTGLYPVSIRADTAYQLEGFIAWESASATPDVQWRFALTSATVTGDILEAQEGGVAFTGAFTGVTRTLALGAATAAGFSFRGRFFTTVAGELDFEWAQNISNGTATRMLAGSWLSVRPAVNLAEQSTL